MYASEDGHKEVVELLLSAGADVNLKDNVCRLIVMMTNVLFCFLF